MNTKKLFLRLKNLLLPILLALGLSGVASESFASNGSYEKVAAVKAKKKAPPKAKDKQAKKTHAKKKADHKPKREKQAKKTHTNPKAKESKTRAHDHTQKTQKNKQKVGKAPSSKDTHRDRVVGKHKDGRTIYVGPRGGHYYINDAGNKVYVK